MQVKPLKMFAIAKPSIILLLAYKNFFYLNGFLTLNETARMKKLITTQLLKNLQKYRAFNSRFKK